MKRTTLRRLMKAAIPVNVALLVLVLYDYYRNGSAWMTPLLLAYGAFLLALLLLFFARPQAPPEDPGDATPLDDDGTRVAIAQRR